MTPWLGRLLIRAGCKGVTEEVWKEDRNMSADKKALQIEVSAALEKVLRSKTFSRADSIRQILKYIVEKGINGNADNIKEYSIATEGLGRAPDFDPKADSIVRIQVQRLRKRLEEYYSDEGAADPVRIEIPAGHYVPTFRAFPTASPPVQSPEPLQSPQPSQPSVVPGESFLTDSLRRLLWDYWELLRLWVIGFLETPPPMRAPQSNHVLCPPLWLLCGDLFYHQTVRRLSFTAIPYF